jgi:hypothetical protein
MKLIGFWHMLLDLEYPVMLEIVPYSRINKTHGPVKPGHEFFNLGDTKAYGCYWFENGEHIITVAEDMAPKGSRIYKATIIHEMIHAWQFENLGRTFKRTHHGKRDYFIQWQELIYNEYGIWI